jgi:mRNA-degrading endonuclease RelE of RelBE toxin-antitoxin system
MSYQILIPDNITAKLETFPLRERFQILTKIKRQLTEQPFPRGKVIRRIRYIRGTVFRLRAGDYRVFYYVKGDTVHVLEICSKKEADRYIASIRREQIPPEE